MMLPFGPIPMLPASPRLYAEIALVVLLLIASGTTITYRALYKAEHGRVSEQLSNISAASAKGASEAWQKTFDELTERAAKDKATAQAAAQSAVARAIEAESAMDKLRRSRRAEAESNPCLDGPLSPATRERLQQLEDSYGSRP